MVMAIFVTTMLTNCMALVTTKSDMIIIMVNTTSTTVTIITQANMATKKATIMAVLLQSPNLVGTRDSDLAMLRYEFVPAAGNLVEGSA